MDIRRFTIVRLNKTSLKTFKNLKCNLESESMKELTKLIKDRKSLMLTYRQAINSKSALKLKDFIAKKKTSHFY
jgi:hypothetical protein